MLTSVDIRKPYNTQYKSYKCYRTTTTKNQQLILDVYLGQRYFLTQKSFVAMQFLQVK